MTLPWCVMALPWQPMAMPYGSSWPCHADLVALPWVTVVLPWKVVAIPWHVIEMAWGLTCHRNDMVIPGDTMPPQSDTVHTPGKVSKSSSTSSSWLLRRTTVPPLGGGLPSKQKKNTCKYSVYRVSYSNKTLSGKLNGMSRLLAELGITPFLL